MSADRGMDKENVNEYYSAIKKRKFCLQMSETEWHAKLTNSDTERQSTVWSYLYVKYKKVKLIDVESRMEWGMGRCWSKGKNFQL